MTDEMIDRILHATGFIYEHIKLADQKALVFIALNGSLTGGLYSIHVLSTSGWRFVLGLAAFALLLLATGLALAVIVPRRGPHVARPGLIDPGRVTKFGDAAAYLQHVRASNPEDFEVEVGERVFDLCTIDRAKYRWLHTAIGFSAVAWLVALWVALLTEWGV